MNDAVVIIYYLNQFCDYKYDRTTNGKLARRSVK